MRWKTGRRSNNVEDRRGRRGAIPGGGIAVGGGTMILLLLGFMLLGGNPGSLIDILGGGGGIPLPDSHTTSSTRTPGSPTNQAANDEEADFVSVVLGSTEDAWSTIFKQYGARYTPPKLVLFDGYVQSACGMTSAAAGPFYCPGDRQVYIDLSFFRELNRLGAPGDFARAYVVGHEVGHHIQNLAGISDQVRRLQMRTTKANSNALSVLVELQADCYAGVWANYANKQSKMLEPGDVEEGLRAAKAIGDDQLMKHAGRTVHPDSFTHGSSAQRVKWLRTGLATGKLEDCDTFSKAGLTLN